MASDFIGNLIGNQRDQLVRDNAAGIARARSRFGNQRGAFSSFGSPTDEYGFANIERTGQDALSRGLADLSGRELGLRWQDEQMRMAREQREADRRAARENGLFGLGGGVLGALATRGSPLGWMWGAGMGSRAASASGGGPLDLYGFGDEAATQAAMYPRFF